MTDAPSTNAQQQASSTVMERKDWKTPVLDVLALASAEAGTSHVFDGHSKHKSG
ncbi:MAG: hypothetical protein QOH85_640 [Acidobacteriaceae bacterium]|jgi:hypothetical protein|nr:hypothetical protein [Acidobacteriaceae bacterium]